MASLVRVADSFINVRASFKIGPADIHTHASLVKRKNGKWLMLDSVKMEDAVKAEVDSLTDGGKALEAVLNVHPFHTVCPFSKASRRPRRRSRRRFMARHCKCLFLHFPCQARCCLRLHILFLAVPWTL
jgi:hypothetical protein